MPPPCFMGIVPGETWALDAVDILQSHEWVHEIDGFSDGFTWTSSRYFPRYRYVGDGRTGILNGSAIIWSIDVEAGIMLNELWLALGPPHKVTADGYSLLIYAFPPFTEEMVVYVRYVCDDKALLETKTVMIRFVAEPPSILNDAPESTNPVEDTQAILSRVC